MQEHIKVGREYPEIDLNTSYSFGLDDQEFVVAFETDDPAAFLDLVQRLRTTEASAYTKRDTPTFTCVAMLGRAGAQRARRHARSRSSSRHDDRAAPRLRRDPRHHGDRRRAGRPLDRLLGRHAPGQRAGHRLAARDRRPVHDAVSREVDLRRPRPPEGARQGPRRAAARAVARAVRRPGPPRDDRRTRSPGTTTSSCCTPTAATCARAR